MYHVYDGVLYIYPPVLLKTAENQPKNMHATVRRMWDNILGFPFYHPLLPFLQFALCCWFYTNACLLHGHAEVKLNRNNNNCL